MPTYKPPPTTIPEPAVSLADLSPAEAYSVGASVGELLKGGMPISRAVDATQRIADFIRRGQQAQAAVDAILAAEAGRKGWQREAAATQAASRQLAAVIEWCEASGFPTSAADIRQAAMQDGAVRAAALDKVLARQVWK